MAKRLNRRSFLARVGGAMGAGGALALIAGGARAQRGSTGLWDWDNSDQRGEGRTGSRARYHADSDGTDESGYVYNREPTGPTDSDPRDRSGAGRGTAPPAGPTDSDPTDRPGQGRGVQSPPTTGR